MSKSTIFHLRQDGSSWVEPVLSKDQCVLLKEHTTLKPVLMGSESPSQSQGNLHRQ